MRKFLPALMLVLMACSSQMKPTIAPSLYEGVNPNGVFMVLYPTIDEGTGLPGIYGGTGFCVPGTLGHIMTAAHAVDEGVWVKNAAGEDWPVTVVSKDVELDVAVLELVGDNAQACALSGMSFAAHNALPGSPAMLYGYGALLLKPVVTRGTISSVEGAASNHPTIQVAQLNALHGHSGSPIFNEAGKIVGMLVGGFEAGDEMDTIVPVEELRKVVK